MAMRTNNTTGHGRLQIYCNYIQQFDWRKKKAFRRKRGALSNNVDALRLSFPSQLRIVRPFFEHRLLMANLVEQRITLKIAEEIGARREQVVAAVALLDEGATVPFISRYRKEVTGGLDDIQLRLLDERLVYLRELEDRRAAILASIDEQGKLTPELAAQIGEAETKQSLEDLYLPYKPKRRTKAQIAREAGLAPLAEAALAELDAFASGAWGQKFPTVAAAWRRAWERVIPFFAFPLAIRKVIYTTNAIESINARLRKIIKTRGHFPSDDAATKLIWLALRNITSDWGRAAKDWKEAMNQFAILYAERFETAHG